MGITSGELSLLSSILVLTGTLSGYFFAGQNESKRDERARDREVLARKETRTEERERFWHEFQLTTMLELQDAIRELARATGLVLVADETSLRNQGKYFLIPEELNEHAYSARRDLIRLMHRVTNNDLRRPLQDFNNRTATMVLIGRNAKDLDLEMELGKIVAFQSELADMFGDVNEKLGLHLRAMLEWQPSA